MTISQSLAEFILSVDPEKMPVQAVNAAKTHFIDGMSCMFFGVNSASVKLALKYDRASGAAGDCLFPDEDGYKTSAESCAMLCAMAAHSNDFDDMSISLNGHPSALLVPVVYAAAQKYKCTGAEMLAAYIAGVETDAILGKIFADGGHYKGWNTTCLIGIFGAVAAAGRIMKLDRGQLANALGIAANEASGVKANYGTLSKDLAIGSAARKAMMAAECARLGMDSSADAFEGEFGLLSSLGGVDAEKAKEIIGSHESDFVSPGLVMKPYPSCRGNHSGIEAATELSAQFGIGTDDVDRVVCYVDQAAHDTDRYEHPKTPEQAKFSLAFCIGKVMTSGRVTKHDFIGEEIADKAALAFVDKVKIECRPELFTESRFGTEVRIELKDGRTLSRKVCFPKGDPQNPMSTAEIQQKLRGCLEAALGTYRANAAVEVLERFDTLADIEDLIVVLK